MFSFLLMSFGDKFEKMRWLNTQSTWAWVQEYAINISILCAGFNIYANSVLDDLLTNKFISKGILIWKIALYIIYFIFIGITNYFQPWFQMNSLFNKTFKFWFCFLKFFCFPFSNGFHCIFLLFLNSWTWVKLNVTFIQLCSEKKRICLELL